MNSSILLGAALLTFLCTSNVEARGRRHACSPVGGTVAASFVTTEQGQILVGTVTGTLRGAVHGIPTAPIPQADGSLNLEVFDHFVTEEGVLLQTLAEVTLTPISGLPGVFHHAATYDVVGGTGKFANAEGSLVGHGEVDTNTGQVTIRYQGEICGAIN